MSRAKRESRPRPVALPTWPRGVGVTEDPRTDGGAPLSPRTRVWILAALAIILGASFPYLSRMMNANERPRVLQAMSWVDTGELAIDGPGARGIPPGIDIARSPVDGRLYPNKPPGATVLAAVGYGALRVAAAVRGHDPTLREVMWVVRLVGGLLPALALAWFMLRRFGSSAPALVLLLVGTPIVSYARLLFGHVPAAALLCAGVIVVADALGDPERRRRAFFGGMLAASAVAFEYGAVFGGIPLAVLVIRAARDPNRRPVALAAVAGAALPIALLALYHDAVFGSPWTTPYHHVVDKAFAATHARGLLGLALPTANSLYEHLLSPWGGLLYWAPLCVLALGLAVARFKTLTPIARLTTVTFGVLLAFNLGLTQTGGWRVGPRYLVVAMPLLVVPLSELSRELVTRWWLGAALVGLSFWSALVNFVAGNLLPYPVPAGNPLADQLLPLWTEGYAPYSVLSPIFGASGALSAVGVVTAVTLAWALLSLRWPTARAMFIALAGGVVLAMLAFVAALAIPPAPDAVQSLRAIAGIWEPRAGQTVMHTELPSLSADP